MLIRDVKNYLLDKKQAAVDELCFHLQQDKESVKQALHILIQNGWVEEVKLAAPCKGCSCGSSCFEQDNVLYKIKQS
ncbi:MAG: FeoC-like transcriptional regulator [Spirochaetes bacterium]|nr:FeoC-like transcriptional regulator [Spirochaetota bacterium]